MTCRDCLERAGASRGSRYEDDQGRVRETGRAGAASGSSRVVAFVALGVLNLYSDSLYGRPLGALFKGNASFWTCTFARLRAALLYLPCPAGDSGRQSAKERLGAAMKSRVEQDTRWWLALNSVRGSPSVCIVSRIWVKCGPQQRAARLGGSPCSGNGRRSNSGEPLQHHCNVSRQCIPFGAAELVRAVQQFDPLLELLEFPATLSRPRLDIAYIRSKLMHGVDACVRMPAIVSRAGRRDSTPIVIVARSAHGRH
jgi:hypothetical protein